MAGVELGVCEALCFIQIKVLKGLQTDTRMALPWESK